MNQQLQRRALLCLALACGMASATTIDIGTDGTGAWTVSVPSQGIVNATPHTGYMTSPTTSITPFSGAGGCTSSACTSTFDGYWTAKLTFTLPSNATSVTLNFSDLEADDRAVLELNGSIIGDAYAGSASGPAAGFMTLTDGGANNAYDFGGSSSESGVVTTGFDLGGTNTLLLIVNNTEGGQGLDPHGFTVAGLSGDVTYDVSSPVGPVSSVPEPTLLFPTALVLFGMAAPMALRRRGLP